VELKILHTPGHTTGGISIVSNGFIFTGDLILSPETGAMDLEEADEAIKEKSLREVIAPLASGRNVTIYPGHGQSFLLAQE